MILEQSKEVLPGIISQNQAMQSLAKTIEKIAASHYPVFFHGETGTGKELFAQALHQLSGHTGKLIAVNCSSIPENLFESLFFGHEKGSFSGASQQHHGFFAQAKLGTLFLDEIAELSFPLQSKLLRVLETQEFRRIGSQETQTFTGRVITASHVNLRQAVDNKAFREDLYYRLNLLEIQIPSLAARRDDIPLLVQFFSANHQNNKLSEFSDCAIKLLQQASWPGNIRQLKNTIDRILILNEKNQITAEDIQKQINLKQPFLPLQILAINIIDMPIENKIKAIGDALIQEAIKVSLGNKTQAAELLGIHRKVIERRLAQIG